MSVPPPSIPLADVWEAAYLRFESPHDEVREFQRRLRELGAHTWPRDSRIVELFCGRGSGLVALHQLGFEHLSGVDLSAALVARHTGPGRVIVGDCRDLPLESAGYDIAIVQGGLHHLPQLPDDLEKTLSQAQRILRPGGRFIAVEPWPTFFLAAVHRFSRNPLARRAWPKVDAFQTMVENELETYKNWLSRPQEILDLFGRFFTPQLRRVRWGKLVFVGSR